MAPIRRSRKRPAQLPHPVWTQDKIADPFRPPNGGPYALKLGSQSRFLSHTDHQTLNSPKKVNQVHGAHHDLTSAEENGVADKFEKPAPRKASEVKSSLQNHQMEDKHGVSEPNQDNIIPPEKEMMLESGNQHEETAVAGKQINVPAHQKDPKGPRRSSKFHGVSFNAQNKFWEAFVWDPAKKRDPRKNAGIPKRRKCTGGQWYLGLYDTQEEAAQIHDKAVIKLGRHEGPKGTRPCPLNFPLSNYAADIEEMKECGGESTKDYFLRLRASYAVGFVQGKVDMRGVTGPKKNSAKYVAGYGYKDSETNRKVDIHLGSFEDKVKAGKCYDKAALFYKRGDARTNFPHDSYTKEEIEAYGRQLQAKRQKLRG